MKKILIVSLGILFFLTNITFAENTNTHIQNSFYNNPPNPPVITGPTSGKTLEGYVYTTEVSDPDEDDILISIEVNFGDGVTTCGGCDGLGPWHSGDVQQFNHSWIKSGNFEITGRVQDEHGVWSEWSDPIPITMPYSNNPMPQFLERFSQRFPTAFPLLRQLLGY